MVDKGDRDLFTSAAALVGSDELDRRACQVELVEEQGRRTQARRSSMSAKLSHRSLTEPPQGFRFASIAHSSAHSGKRKATRACHAMSVVSMVCAHWTRCPARSRPPPLARLDSTETPS